MPLNETPHENFLRTPLSNTKSSEKIKRLILQLRTVKPSSTCLWLSIQFTYEKEWWQHTSLSESKTNGERSWSNSPDTDTNFWAGMQWLYPKAWKALGTPKHFTRNLVACFLEEVDKACVDAFATLPRFTKSCWRVKIWSVMLLPGWKPHWASFNFVSIISLHLFSRRWQRKC